MNNYIIFGQSEEDFENAKLKIKNIHLDKDIAYHCLKDIFIILCNNHQNAFNLNDLVIQYARYDEDLKKDIYCIKTNQYNNENYLKKYGAPQFLCYIIEIAI